MDLIFEKQMFKEVLQVSSLFSLLLLLLARQQVLNAKVKSSLCHAAAMSLV